MRDRLDREEGKTKKGEKGSVCVYYTQNTLANASTAHFLKTANCAIAHNNRTNYDTPLRTDVYNYMYINYILPRIHASLIRPRIPEVRAFNLGRGSGYLVSFYDFPPSLQKMYLHWGLHRLALISPPWGPFRRYTIILIWYSIVEITRPINTAPSGGNGTVSSKLSEMHVESSVARLTSDICWNELGGTKKLPDGFNSRTWKLDR
jgi:hypothetical protein